MGWGGASGHMQAGIGFRTDGYDTNTPSIAVYADLYVASVNWGYTNDTQNLNYWGQLGTGNIGYVMNSPSGTSTQKFVGTIAVGGQGQSYSGGPTYGVGIQVSGAYDGSAPSYTEYFNLPARPPNYPTNPGLSVSGVGVNSATINVTASDPRGSTVTQYEAWVTSNNAPPGSGGTVVTSAIGGSFVATGLAASTNYWAWTRALNGVGYSNGGLPSGGVGFTTSGNPPAAVATPTVGTLSATGAVLNWTAPSNGGSAITGYTVQVADDAGMTQNVQTYPLGNVLTYTYTGSGPGSRKYFKVRAVNGVGNGPYSSVVTFDTVQTPPTVTAPVEGATRNDGTASVTVSAAGLRTNRVLHVQFAKDNAFTTGVIDSYVSPTTSDPGNSYNVVEPTAYLGSQTWYTRARIENSDLAINTAWSTVVSFIEAHTPISTTVAPIGGAYRVWAANVAFTFNTTDSATGDSVTAYQIIVERNDTGATVTDTGKVSLAFANGLQTVNVAVPSTVKDIALRWRVRTWDEDDDAGSYSANAIFTVVDLPTVTITAPGSTVSIGSPTVTWTFAATSGRTQALAEVSVVQNDTGYVAWAASTTVAAQRSLTPTTTILQNTKTYTVTVKVTDSVGLQRSVTSTFTSSYDPPSVINYEVSNPDIDELGYVRIDWSNATADPSLVAWRIYRQILGTGVWEMLAEYTDQSVTQYKDYLVCDGLNYLYNVTQVANRFGSNLESPVGLVLKSILAPVRINLMKNANSETSVAMVAGTNATVTRQTLTTMRGTAFTRVAATAAGDVIAMTPIGTSGAVVTAGTQYTASLAIRRNGGTARATGVQIGWYTAAGALISTTPTSVTTLDTGTVAATRYVSAPAPATAAFASIVLNITGAGSGETWDVDDILFEAGNTPGAYFDGAVSPDPLNFAPGWTGTTNNSSSTLTEIPYGAETRVIDIDLLYYWIVVPDVPELSTVLKGVVGDPSTLEFEEATYNIIGRGRHRDYGDRLGYTGTLSIQVRTPESTSSIRLKVEQMREAQETYWLRTPFGKLFPVALGDIGWDPMKGVGKSEMGDLSIPYEEVS